ncbi:MAG: hypothetical protein ABFS30_13925, partial [Pseudomonadota bacterium]
APAAFTELYGVEAPDAAGYVDAANYIARFFGASLIGFAIISWLARYSANSTARQAIVLGFALGDALGFLIALISMLQGVYNALGWSTVAVYLLLALGFGYFQFIAKE